jgi:hypothetical protein
MLENAGRRSARDWIVDVAMFVLAAGIGIYILVETWGDHDGVEVLLDFVLGVAAWLALWFRRSRPTEVAVFAVAASAFSALAAGPGVIALFNAAIRTPGRTLALIVGLAVTATAIFPLFFPGRDRTARSSSSVPCSTPWWSDGVCSSALSASSCTRCASAPRSARPSIGSTSSRRATPSVDGSRARCTTFSPTASRC